MMRQKPSAAMQKTYDECYLVCSTAVYFETQGNEAEALRSWRSALDQIYYFNAYRRPAAWVPKSETEKALQASLRELELQCKERVDLLEALKQSRKDTKKEKDSVASNGLDSNAADATPTQERAGWLGEGTVPAVTYPALSRPPLPKRPSLPKMTSRSSDGGRSHGLSAIGTSSSSSIPTLPVPSLKKSARTPSPEKRGGMLKTLRPTKDGRKTSSSRTSSGLKGRPPAAAKAATQAWSSIAGASVREPAFTAEDAGKDTISAANTSKEASARPSLEDAQKPNGSGADGSPSPFYFRYAAVEDGNGDETGNLQSFYFATPAAGQPAPTATLDSHTFENSERRKPPTPPPHQHLHRPLPTRQKTPEALSKTSSGFPSYRSEYPSGPVNAKKLMSVAAPKPREPKLDSGQRTSTGAKKPQRANASATIRRKAVTTASSSRAIGDVMAATTSGDDSTSSSFEREKRIRRRQGKAKSASVPADLPPTPTSQTSEDMDSEASPEDQAWKERMERVMKHLPKGVDEAAAKQIFNEIVIHGDEVHWADVAGLEIAKSALKETVVYPFLRPDLFMGLREPARGMLLFGPPGTGKTMLARAVATESRSTFFAISASSLTSKYLGESEKLVRALFQLAKALAPSIIFVDEIDSLLSSRSGSTEHEATRRIKTEFLIQWSDLAKAAAGREQNDKEREKGDASRVLVLAATNLPWAIDEAARRRFVRRQYIPLPEGHVRKLQLQTLLSHQKHSIADEELDELVGLTEGFSGSDITALAKDAAMGPLRSLGEKLLHMTMDEIRPIQFGDFEASLVNIRPSVSKQGLKEFEDWAKEFGERGG